MKFHEYRQMIFSDLYRIYGKINLYLLFKQLFFGESYKYIFWMRTCKYTRNNKLLLFTIYPIARLSLRHYKYKYGISISSKTEIGLGFYIAHFGGITVNEKVTIGKNCNISYCITLGQANRGKNKGYPVIGDNVYIGPGARIVGGVRIGNNVAIGANCVVTKDIPSNSVVVGVPGRVISQKGSIDYVNRIDYEDKIKVRRMLHYLS